MELHYLDFEFSDEAQGRGSFDALASVAPVRLPALLAEVSAVLRWAARHFGPAGALEDEGDWDFDLQAHAEPGGAALALEATGDTGEWRLAAGAQPWDRCTLGLTLGGSEGFCRAFREAFPEPD
ncbi:MULTISPECIES: hypothetical protein [Ramlibacter]|uniref:Uncharacterized protein n=1 Tax=Ramlibacter aquaticus TaxID=2780094 RepID=A0ABR9SGB4_9BURK|nr:MULTISPECIES: hypothetical protein [Ramlibacter]MBE7941092.1 hypothetical protein [Ramlibacter aquaticus]